jgi:hypothetical protein
VIDCAAKERHFLDHLAPVWHALGDDQGTFWVAPELLARARKLGIDARGQLPDSPGPTTLVAAYGDLTRARRAGRPIIIMEHGAGQTYEGVRSGSYITGEREGVLGVLVPGEHHAAIHRAHHPDVPVHVIGCPKLDRWHTAGPRASTGRTVAISFHWECKLAPEARSAWRHYAKAMPALAGRFDRVIGHGHPRIIRNLAGVYVSHGFDVLHDFADVLDLADVYVCDNSSTLFEFASTGRPVVLMNAPWYRRDIEHGLRFWSHADIGLQCNQPMELTDTIDRALADQPEIAARREQLIDTVYAHRDGTSATAAANAIRTLARQEAPA